MLKLNNLFIRKCSPPECKNEDINNDDEYVLLQRKNN